MPKEEAGLNPKPGDLVLYAVRDHDRDSFHFEEKLGLVIGLCESRPLLRVQPIASEGQVLVYPSSVIKLITHSEEKKIR